jgi:hypothetical protein
MQEEKLVEGFANYFQNIDGKHEKGATTGKLQISVIQRVSQLYKLNNFFNDNKT